VTATRAAAGAASRQLEYAVAWRGTNGVVASGRIDLEGSELVLRGSGPGGSVARDRLSLERIAAIRIGRTAADRIHGERSVVLELRGDEVLAIAPLGAAGAVFELADLVAELSASAPDRVARVAVVLPLRAGTAARARELVAEGPPFDLEQADLERHQVFVSDREAVFLFEGDDARETLERLVRNPRVLREAARWRECLAGRPRLAEESYAWHRDA